MPIIPLTIKEKKDDSANTTSKINITQPDEAAYKMRYKQSEKFNLNQDGS